MIGTRVGPYEILAKLGEGGMGQVWRARDFQLGRDVALKVLPEGFTQDAERLQRFEREARLLAQLNHPNIAQIYGMETSGETRALVMELVEGPTLAERLESGLLPFNESLSFALQIAQALEEAHEKGIVHRDLKPQNVKASKEGKIKVLDFGLAKAMDPAAGSPPSASHLAHSPTITLGGTRDGVILGTAAYMAPEQARGVAVDKRADIWAFGVVLWELLAGDRLFAGSSVVDTLSAVMRQPIDFGSLPGSTPAPLRDLVRRCLEREPRNRLRDIGDARLVLAELMAAPPGETASPAAPEVGARPRWRSALPWLVAAAALAVAAWTLVRDPRGAGAGTDAGAARHLELSLPPGVDLVTRVPAGLAVSPDGRTIAMIGFRAGQRRLYIRGLESPDTTEIKSSSGVNAVAFSPDGASIAFVPGGSRIVRVSLADQQSSTLVTCADLRNSVSWGERGIYFLCDGEIWRSTAAGGEPEQLTRRDAGRHEVLHTDALELPGARHLLFANLTDDAATSRIEALSLDDGTRTIVMEPASTPVISATGHLLFEREGAIWAVPFDSSRAAASGRAVEVLAAASLAPPLYGSLPYRLSRSGTLLYMPREFEEKRVLTVARDGSERALDLPPSQYVLPRVSPDGRRVLLERSQTIEALDVARGTRTQIASGTFGNSFGMWSDDGRIVFRRHTVPVWVAADGSGRGGPLLGATIDDYPSAPGPEPGTVLTVRIRPETAGDILLRSIDGDPRERTLLGSAAYEGGAQLSPDRRWLVYQSNESGEPEIYVRAYPALDRAWQVSEGGGAQVRWSRDGREIYYRGGGRFMAAAFDGRSAEPRLGRPFALFADEFDFGPGITAPNYDVTPEGRFIFLRRTTASGRIRVALDWLPELERRIAAAGSR